MFYGISTLFGGGFSEVKMARGTNPKSLLNLSTEGRPTEYDERKEDHKVTVTPTGWRGVKQFAKSLSLSVSGLLEKLGRGQLLLVSEDELEIIQKILSDIRNRQELHTKGSEPSDSVSKTTR
jgi:hypothetical protein